MWVGYVVEREREKESVCVWKRVWERVGVRERV